VKQAIKNRDGIALEVTKNTEPAAAAAPLGHPLYSGEIVKKPLDAATPPNQQPPTNKKPKEGS
jgi:hypothetical protein